jgi:hypothetical protein
MLARYTRPAHTLLPRLRTIASQANLTDRSHLFKAGLRPCSELRPLVIFDRPIHPHQPSPTCRPMSNPSHSTSLGIDALCKRRREYVVVYAVATPAHDLRRPMSGVMQTAASSFFIATCLPALKSELKNHNLLPHSQESTTDNTLSQHHVETTE